jgi:predicted RNA binding protein YcfA (HicA-like mRNA interferase family)
MTRLPVTTARKVLQALQRAGFYIQHIKGSHYYLMHPNKPSARVTLAYHAKEDLKRRTLQSIIEQAQMSIDEFLNFL